MHPPHSSAPAAPSAARRPSLLGHANPQSAGDRDASGFGVSILGALEGGPRPLPKPRHGGPAPSRAWRWWLGMALAAASLWAVAQWQQRARPGEALATAPTPVPAPAVTRPAPQALAPAVAPAQAALVLPTASAPTETPATRPSPLAVLDSPVPEATPPQRARPTPAPRKLTAAASPPSAKPATAPQTRAASAKPSNGKDADAELLAALMAHSDALAPAPGSPPPALSDTERKRLQGALRACRGGSNARQPDECRAKACQRFGAAGRSPSCPATPPAGSAVMLSAKP